MWPTKKNNGKTRRLDATKVEKLRNLSVLIRNWPTETEKLRVKSALGKSSGVKKRKSKLETIRFTEKKEKRKMLRMKKPKENRPGPIRSRMRLSNMHIGSFPLTPVIHPEILGRITDDGNYSMR